MNRIFCLWTFFYLRSRNSIAKLDRFFFFSSCSTSSHPCRTGQHQTSSVRPEINQCLFLGGCTHAGRLTAGPALSNFHRLLWLLSHRFQPGKERRVQPSELFGLLTPLTTECLHFLKPLNLSSSSSSSQISSNRRRERGNSDGRCSPAFPFGSRAERHAFICLQMSRATYPS